jgi:hypothetical protein
MVETRAPRYVYRPLPGERCTVPPKTARHVHGEADSEMELLPPVDPLGSINSCVGLSVRCRRGACGVRKTDAAWQLV